MNSELVIPASNPVKIPIEEMLAEAIRTNSLAGTISFTGVK